MSKKQTHETTATAESKSVETLITPEDAARMLLRNTKNRPLDERYVTQLSNEMIAGRWKFTGEPVIFSDKGLLNGQHRLSAIVASGKAQRMLVVSGVAQDAFDAIDIGKRRSVADILSIAGEQDGKRLASTLSLLLKYLTGNMKNRSFRVTPQQAEELLRKEPDVVMAVNKIKELGGKPIMPFSVLAACYFLFAKLDQARADKVIEWLSTGAGMETGNPILLLRERVLQKAPGTRMSSEYQFGLLVKTWNALRENKPMTVLRLGPKEEFPAVR